MSPPQGRTRRKGCWGEELAVQGWVGSFHGAGGGGGGHCTPSPRGRGAFYPVVKMCCRFVVLGSKFSFPLTQCVQVGTGGGRPAAQPGDGRSLGSGPGAPGRRGVLGGGAPGSRAPREAAWTQEVQSSWLSCGRPRGAHPGVERRGSGPPRLCHLATWIPLPRLPQARRFQLMPVSSAIRR